jgi:hypothetical protein
VSITRASFTGGKIFTSEIVGQILAVGLQTAPIFSAMTPRSTSRGTVTFPTGDPSGFDWTPELGTIPTVDPGDGALVAAVAKLSGLLLLSNESIGDTDLNLTDEVGRLIAESMAPKADTDLTYGPPAVNAAAPDGFYSGLTKVTKTTLRAAVVDACAAMMAAGGTPTDVLLSPALWAAEVNRRESTTASSGLLDDLGIPLTVKVAATLKATDALVMDKAGCFAITRNDYEIEASDQAGEAWSKDGVSLRVKARLGVAIPSPAKHARSVAVGS